MAEVTLCACGSGREFAACCAPFIQGAARPQTAEQLMRSRYVAYAMGAEDYLLRTWHSSTRPESLGLSAAGTVRWLGLKILDHEAGGPADDTGVVEFVARYKPAGRAERLHERSRFVREQGQWFYLDGAVEGSGPAPP